MITSPIDQPGVADTSISGFEDCPATCDVDQEVDVAVDVHGIFDHCRYVSIPPSSCDLGFCSAPDI